MKDLIKAGDNVTITLRDAVTGSVTYRSVHNAVMKPGGFHVLDRMQSRADVGSIGVDSSYVAVGTGSVATDYWTVGLGTEVSGIGNPGRLSPNSVTKSAYTVLVSTFFNASSASGNLSEAGVFVQGYGSGGTLLDEVAHNGSGVLFAYSTFSQVSKDSTNTLTLDWEFAF